MHDKPLPKRTSVCERPSLLAICLALMADFPMAASAVLTAWARMRSLIQTLLTSLIPAASSVSAPAFECFLALKLLKLVPQKATTNIAQFDDSLADVQPIGPGERFFRWKLLLKEGKIEARVFSQLLGF